MFLSAHRLKAYGWLLLNTIAWGATIPIVKWGLGDTTPFRFLLYRFAIGSLLCLPILLYYWKTIHKKFRLLIQVAGVELIGTTLALAVLYVGLTQTSSLEAGLITTTTPIFITIAGILFLRERVTHREWTGLAIASILTIILSLIPALVGKSGFGLHNVWGNSLILLQNIINAAYFLLAKKVYKTLPKLLTTAVSILVGFVSFWLLSLIEVGGQTETLNLMISHDLSHPRVWIIAFFAAIVTSIIGLSAYIKGQELIEVSEASLFGYLQPLVYIPLSFWLLQETVHPLQIVCFVLVLGGVWWAEWKPAKKVSRTNR